MMNYQQIMKEYSSISIEEIQQIMTNMLKDIHQICMKYDIPYCLAFGSLLGAIRHNGFIPWDDDMDIFMLRKDYLRFVEVAKIEFGDKYFLQTPQTDSHFDLLHVPYKIRDNQSTFIEEPNKKYHQGAFIDIFVLDDVCDVDNLNKALKKHSMLSSLKMAIDFNQLSGVKKYVRILLQLIFKLIPAKCIFSYTQKAAENLCKDENSEYVQVGIEHMERLKMRRDDIFPCKLHTFADTQFNVPCHPEAILETIYGDYMKLPPEEQRIPHAGFYYNKKLF